MLSVFEKGIIELIKGSLTGSVPQIDSGFDYEKAYEYAQQRQITPLLYYGAVNIPGFMDTLIGKKFFKSTMNLSFFCAEQSEAIKSVRNEFGKNKIQLLAVKGTILRELYPYPEMRLMSDADILIKEEEYERIKPIMIGLGFEEQYESDHELVWKKGKISIELHKRLVPSYNKDYYKYFGDGWKIATIKNEETCEYFMTPEDCFIYTFVHFAKHYRDGGIGIKHIVDFYVYLNKYPNLDFGYIEKELETLQLLRFWQNTKKVLDVWFGSAESDDLSDFITAKIFESETYGTFEGGVNAEAIRLSKTTTNVKKKKMLSLIFPPFHGMKKKYGILNKVPILLPFMWGVRWIEALFNFQKVKNQKKILDMMSDENINKYQSELNYVGLDFNFE